MAKGMSSNKRSKAIRVKSEEGKGFVEVGRKLGIAIPAGLFLLASMNVNVAADTQNTQAVPRASVEQQGLRSNEVAGQLLDYAKNGVQIASAANCNGIHGDSHVDKNDPNVTNNGKHGNVHTNNHGDSCRY
jgi:hypothetical protein